MNTGTIENTIGMKLALIPSGAFVMGSAGNERNRDSDEGPQRRVTISTSFRMSIHPVTQQQYQRVMARNYSKFNSADRPAEMVSHPDALEFCAKLSELTGQQYSLPAEAQWEYACRAGGGGVYSFGDDPRLLDEYAWHYGNSDNQTHPVGLKKPNAWGLYDMHGNVWEWCADLWSAQGYLPGDATDPIGKIGYTHILRGGCFYSDPQALRCAKRFGYNETNRFGSVGFRVVVK
jgi:formylglycine-generating enzyme required for sulfatase activity